MPRRKTCQPLRASPINSSKSISSTPRENAMKIRPDSLRFKENELPVSPQDHSAATDPLPKLRDYVRCPKCNARLLLKNLERHRNKMHEYIAPPPPRTLSVGLRPQTLYVRLRPPRRVRPPFRRAPPPRPGSLVRCHACNRHILEKSLKKHRQMVHGKKAAARTGRKGTPNCPQNNNKGISRKAQARFDDPSVVYIPSSSPKAYTTCETCGDKMNTKDLLKHNDTHHPNGPNKPSPGSKWTKIQTNKHHLQMPECKRCAHGKFRNELDWSHHFTTSKYHPYCILCRSGFRGFEEFCVHFHKVHGEYKDS